MAKVDVKEQIVQKFSEPLSLPSTRRIVVWHDSESSFVDMFDRFLEEPPSSNRVLHVYNIDEAGAFELKRQIYRQYGNDDFLLYTSQQKDLSSKGLEKNWLADIWLIADHFQADYASLLMDELGAKDSAVEAIAEYKLFFNAKDRKEKFKKAMPNAASKTDVLLGIFAVILGCKDVSTESLVRAYIELLIENDEPLTLFKKFAVDEAWRAFARARVGYDDNLESLNDFGAHILTTALSAQLPERSLAGFESRISAQHSQYCLNIVHSWMDSDSDASTLYSVARRVEANLNIAQTLASLDMNDLLEADVLPCINEILLESIFNAMANSANLANESLSMQQRRKDLHWYTRVSDYFEALNWATEAKRFCDSHAQGFHLAKPVDVWNAYTNDWYKMDTAYRKFCCAYDKVQKSANDIPDSVRDSLDNLAGWIERVYVNWYLSETNTCWVNASEDQLESIGYIEGVSRQERFFEERVKAGSSDVKRTLVIISDALRFEVAAELSSLLQSTTAGSSEITSMQSIFPSVTSFGMAALLPHNSIGYNMDEDAVYLNGDMKTDTCERRQTILAKRAPNSRCIKSGDLLKAKRLERKDLVGDAEFVYLYHDKIDTTGEKPTTEHDVFNACEIAIEDIVSLIKIATNDLNISRIIVTADHGFLYTRDPLEERDKVSSKDVTDSTAKIGRRFIVATEEYPDDILVKVNMDDIEGGEFYGLAPRECVRIKRAGQGDNYVHGGISLQECCVPVIQFRNKRSGSKDFEAKTPASLQLLSTSRRVTSMMFRVTLWQKECVGGKVLPAEYEIFMTDDCGNEVTEIRKAHADSSSADEVARKKTIQLNLKVGKSYDPSKKYLLTCRNKNNSEIVWTEAFVVDIPFAQTDDFGF